MSADWCAPPLRLQEEDGWHWLQKDAAPILAKWFISIRFEGNWHFSGIGAPSTAFGPSAMGNLGYRYISPVPDPAKFDALVRAARAMWNYINEGDFGPMGELDIPKILAAFREFGNE